VDEENKRWNARPANAIKVDFKLVGDRPAGALPITSPVVDAARAAIGAIGQPVKFIQASSTDSNTPISMGIPAATLGGGGIGGASHSPGEWYTPADAWHGPQSILLTVLSLVGMKGASEPLLPKR
jgi:di/tripeptidase